MPKQKITFETVRKIGLALPGVEDGAAYGSPALKLHGDLLACIPSHKSAEPDSLAVRIDFDQRAELLETDPDVYYLKDHYLNYPCVLVRLSRIRVDALQGLLRASWQFVTTKRSGKRPSRKPAIRRPSGH